MRKMNLYWRQQGQGMVEYALLLIFVVALISLVLDSDYGENVHSMYSVISGEAKSASDNISIHIRNITLLNNKRWRRSSDLGSGSNSQTGYVTLVDKDNWNKLCSDKFELDSDSLYNISFEKDKLVEALIDYGSTKEEAEKKAEAFLTGIQGSNGGGIGIFVVDDGEAEQSYNLTSEKVIFSTTSKNGFAQEWWTIGSYSAADGVYEYSDKYYADSQALNASNYDSRNGGITFNTGSKSTGMILNFEGQDEQTATLAINYALNIQKVTSRNPATDSKST